MRALANQSLAWRQGAQERRFGLSQLIRAEWLRIAAADVIGLADVAVTEVALASLADAVLQTVVSELAPAVPFAVFAHGRFGGSELSYASDLDLLVPSTGRRIPPVAEATAEAMVRYLNGDTPANRIWTVDLTCGPRAARARCREASPPMRPTTAGGRRSGSAKPCCGTLRGRRRLGGSALLRGGRPFVWGRPLSDDEAREIVRMKARIERERIPPGEDPRSTSN